MAQSESGLIGHSYLEECKVGLDSAGYLQTERYYTLLIGSAGALLINQTENRHQEQRKRWGEEGVGSDGWRRTSQEENEVSSSRGERLVVRALSPSHLSLFLVHSALSSSSRSSLLRSICHELIFEKCTFMATLLRVRRHIWHNDHSVY